MIDISDRFKGYTFRFDWTDPENHESDDEAVEVILRTLAGQEYSANFTTRNFLDYLFEKNRRTGECASGTYFAMPSMILVERIDDTVIKETIDDMINNKEIEEYFKPVIR